MLHAEPPPSFWGDNGSRGRNDYAFVYLYHEIDVGAPLRLPLAFGSDDSLAVWLNGERVLANNVVRGPVEDLWDERVALEPWEEGGPGGWWSLVHA